MSARSTDLVTARSTVGTGEMVTEALSLAGLMSVWVIAVRVAEFVTAAFVCTVATICRVDRGVDGQAGDAPLARRRVVGRRRGVASAETSPDGRRGSRSVTTTCWARLGPEVRRRDREGHVRPDQRCGVVDRLGDADVGEHVDLPLRRVGCHLLADLGLRRGDRGVHEDAVGADVGRPSRCTCAVQLIVAPGCQLVARAGDPRRRR